MKQHISISIIGTGNVATQLGLALLEQGYQINQVYGRKKANATTLAKKLKAQPVSDLNQLNSEASIYIIAVKDDAIAEVAKQIRLKDQIVVHTSGSVEMNVLKSTSKNTGVFYPLQSFSKTKKADFKTIPICIEGNNKATSTTLSYFAKSISGNVKTINSSQRQSIHLAAVFANNFSNHMYVIAEELLKKEKLSLDLLKPLIVETANKIKTGKPKDMQTGPAIRGDKKTMEKHLKMLGKDKDLKSLYQLISKNIKRNP